jgi:hypothetical protein
MTKKTKCVISIYLVTYLMWKSISLVNLIYKAFVSDGKTDHLRKVCNNRSNDFYKGALD